MVRKHGPKGLQSVSQKKEKSGSQKRKLKADEDAKTSKLAATALRFFKKPTAAEPGKLYNINQMNVI